MPAPSVAQAVGSTRKPVESIVAKGTPEMVPLKVAGTFSVEPQAARRSKRAKARGWLMRVIPHIRDDTASAGRRKSSQRAALDVSHRYDVDGRTSDRGAAMTGTSYVADVEWVVRTDTVGVRINTLEPGKGTPWHFHSVVNDNLFCLVGSMEVELRGPDETALLSPGQRLHVAPRRIYRVMNRGGSPLRYLLVQATGPYDFVEVVG
jgi:quercetin dioxygenase-like cupin family protein